MFWYYYLNPILIAAAVIPAVALLVRVYRADRLERESRAMLLSLGEGDGARGRFSAECHFFKFAGEV